MPELGRWIDRQTLDRTRSARLRAHRATCRRRVIGTWAAHVAGADPVEAAGAGAAAARVAIGGHGVAGLLADLADLGSLA